MVDSLRRLWFELLDLNLGCLGPLHFWYLMRILSLNDDNDDDDDDNGNDDDADDDDDNGPPLLPTVLALCLRSSHEV